MKELRMTLMLMPMLARHNEKVRTAAARVTCVLLSTMISLFALADSWTDPETGYTWKYEVSGETAEIKDGNYSAAISPNPTGAVTIPSALGGKSVTSIGDWAFYYCSGLTSVSIPNSVTSIGARAFGGCSGLTSLTIPDSVTSIGEYAFSGCSGLTSITIPDSVTSIGEYAFRNCSGLTSVTIPDSVTSIGDWAFGDCSSLANVYITDLAKWCAISFLEEMYAQPGNPLAYAQNLFLNGVMVTDLVIPDSVTSIGSYAFYHYSGLKSVTIPGSVTNIGDYAFCGCTNLVSATIPDSVTCIGNYVFGDCKGLTSVTIPDSVTCIGNYAFGSCKGLTSVTIPDGVTSIGDGAFYNCSSLASVTVPDSIVNYGADCFEGCPAYTRNFYRAIFNGNSSGGSPVVVTTVVQNVEAPYALSSEAADRSIASVTVNGDCSIDSFVLKDGKVYDSMLYVSNMADHAVTLSLPDGYSYKTIKGATPLTIPASSQCLISITRVDANVFLVMREELDDVK